MSQPPQPKPQTQTTWTQLGYPQYQGKYAVPQQPLDYYIQSVKQTPTGLEVTWAYGGLKPTAPPLGMRERALSIGERYVEGKPLDVKELVWVIKTYPEYAKQLEVQKGQQQQAQTIGERYALGEPVGIKDIVWLIKEYPEYARQVEVAKGERERALDIGQRYIQGKPINIKELVWVTKTYPDYTKQIVAGKEQQERMQESLAFYTGLGYPQYGGKYAPFEIPRGYGVGQISETATSLQISFKPQPMLSTTRIQRMQETRAEFQASTSKLIEDIMAFKLPVGVTFGPEAQWVPYGKEVYFYPGRTALVASAIALPAVAPQLGLGISAEAVVKGAAINIGLTEALSYGLTGKPATAKDVLTAALLGEAFTVVGAGAMAGVGKVAERVGGVAPTIASSILGRTAVSAGIGATTGYVMSGGKPVSALYGLGLAVGFSLGMEALGYMGGKLQAHAEDYLTQSYLEHGKLTVFDKALMNIMGVPSPEKGYIVSGQPVSEWTLDREEATISKALIPTGKTEQVGKVGISEWGKGTLWQKPEDMEDTINQWIGSESGQRQALLLKPVVPTETVMTVPTFKVPTIAIGVMPKATVLGTAKLGSINELEATNPFLQYQGKPYFRISKALEDMEYTTVSYPATARTETLLKNMPVLKTDVSTSLINMPALKSDIATSLVSGASLIVGISSASLLRSTQDLGLSQTQFQRQQQSQSQQQLQQMQQLQKQMQISEDLFKRKKFRKTTFGFALYSKKGIKNPIATARQVLEKYL